VARWIALIAVFGVLSGCHKVWRAEVVQPPLRLTTDLGQRTSMPVALARRGVGALGTRTLHHVYFVFISRDRLRFHISLIHRWDRFADPSRWRVWIEDDLGRRFNPEGVNLRSVSPLIISHGGRRVATSIYRGVGDYTFYSRDLYSEKMHRLTLVLQRPGWEYRYTWNFAGGELDERPPPPGRRPRNWKRASTRPWPPADSVGGPRGLTMLESSNVTDVSSR
jgi:hypothetical protein